MKEINLTLSKYPSRVAFSLSIYDVIDKQIIAYKHFFGSLTLYAVKMNGEMINNGQSLSGSRSTKTNACFKKGGFNSSPFEYTDSASIHKSHLKK